MKPTAILIALALSSAPAIAQDYSYSVKRGETIRIFSWSFFGDSCKTTGYPKIRAVRGGKLGKLSSGRGPITVREVSSTRLANCIGKTVQGTVVNYTAGNKAGTDTLRLARKRTNGQEARYDFSITVK